MTHRHSLFARFYARAGLAMERGVGAHRAALLAGVSGRVIEVGAGNGLHFPRYSDEVTEVTEVIAVEPEPHLRSIAGTFAGRTTVPITIVDGLADRLPAADGSCDVAIASLVLCTGPDQDTALAERPRRSSAPPPAPETGRGSSRRPP